MPRVRQLQRAQNPCDDDIRGHGTQVVIEHQAFLNIFKQMQCVLVRFEWRPTVA